MSMTAFWVIEPYDIVEVDRSFKGTYCLHPQGYKQLITLKMEAVGTSETQDNFDEAIRRSHLHKRRRENKKSY